MSSVESRLTCSCNVCGESFERDIYLHGHRVNSEELACRKCIYCGYNFLSKSKKVIKNHMESQHSYFPCEFCNKKYPLKGSLADHIRDVHPERTTPQQAPQSSSTQYLNDLQSCGNSLKRLLDEKVRLDPDEMKRCNEIIDCLVNLIEHNLGTWFGVSEIVKGGSLGNGTSIRQQMDLTLVVFTRKSYSVTELKEKQEEFIMGLKKLIDDDKTFANLKNYSFDTNKRYRASIKIDDGLMEVDILPESEVVRDQATKMMDDLDEKARAYYSALFTKDHVLFTQDKPESVKDAIRLAKYWKTCEKLNISSYTVEIITIKEWERMGSPEKANLKQLFKRTMTQLSDMGNIVIIWDDNSYAGDRPIVMNPVKPYNNTASEIQPNDLSDIERKALEVFCWLSTGVWT